jgi:hypothetical protein
VKICTCALRFIPPGLISGWIGPWSAGTWEYTDIRKWENEKQRSNEQQNF